MSTDPRIPPNDALDPGEPFDARQWAMHGLLRTYFEDAPARERHIRDILRRLGIDPEGASAPAGSRIGGVRTTVARTPPWRRRPVRLAWLWTSGAAAAALLFAVLIYMTTLGPAQAVASAARDLALRPQRLWWLGLDVDALLSNDRVDRSLSECEIAAALAQRDALLYDAARLGIPPSDAVYHAWQRAYQALRSLGRWDEAVGEMYDLAAHAGRFHATETDPSPWPQIALNDVGEMLASIGDTAGARDAFLASLALRESMAAIERTKSDAELRVAKPLNSLIPIYWRLSELSLVEGDIQQAAAWLGRGELLLRDYYAAVCGANDIQVPGDADALAIFERLAPEAFRDPPGYGYQEDMAPEVRARFNGFLPEASAVAMLRAQTYYVARLKRVAGDLAAADALLERAWQIKDCAPADDERLAYAIPLEFARLRIARDDWHAAARWLDKAREGAAAVPSPDEARFLSKPAIRGARVTELTLLSALVTLEVAPNDPSGHELLDSALATVDALATQMDLTQRERFVDQFRAWRELGATPRDPR